MCQESPYSSDTSILRAPKAMECNLPDTAAKSTNSLTVSADAEDARKRGPIPPEENNPDPKTPNTLDIRALP